MCVVPTVYLFVGASGQVNLKFVTSIRLTGVANDTEDGTLVGGALQWHFVRLSGGVSSDLAAVDYGTIVNSIVRGFGKFRINLTVVDSKGKTGTCSKEGEIRALN